MALQEALNTMRNEADYHDEVERIRKERDEAVQQARIYAFEEILPLIEDIERAFDSLPEAMQAGAWYQGAQIIMGTLGDLMDKHEIWEIDPLGQPFDPTIHHAIGGEARGDRPANLVVRTLRKGYRAKGKLLRSPQVIVTK